MKTFFALILAGTMALEAAELTLSHTESTSHEQESISAQLSQLHQQMVDLNNHSLNHELRWKGMASTINTYNSLVPRLNLSDPNIRLLSEQTEELICQINDTNYQLFIKAIDIMIKKVNSSPDYLSFVTDYHTKFFDIFKKTIVKRTDVPDYIKEHIEQKLRSLRALVPHRSARHLFLDNPSASIDATEREIQKLITSESFKDESYNSCLSCKMAIDRLMNTYDLPMRQQALLLDAYISKLGWTIAKLTMSSLTIDEKLQQLDLFVGVCTTLATQVSQEKIKPLLTKLAQIEEILTWQ